MRVSDTTLIDDEAMIREEGLEHVGRLSPFSVMRRFACERP